MRTLVYIEAGNGGDHEDAFGAVSKAARLDGPVTALLCGTGAAALAAEAARHGATRVLVADGAAFRAPLARTRVDLLTGLVRREGFDLVLAPTTVVSADVAGALAARLEAGLVWGLVDIEQRDGAVVGKRMTQGDRVLASIAWTASMRIGLFRPRALAPVPCEALSYVVEALDASEQGEDGEPRLEAQSRDVSQATEALSKADIIVSAGRGIGSRENLAIVRDLAAALGGAVGVSLPLVEMGWAPRSMQVGQTGTVVKPSLYIACGISGQIQHRIGIERSGTIVAINKDAAAPIMSFCDIAVVAELQAVLPALIALVRTRRSMQSDALAQPTKHRGGWLD